MNQIEYQATTAGTSQCSRILARLTQAQGGEVPMPELAAIGSGVPGGFCMVHSRIADLRAEGHNIPPARTQKISGVMHSFYRLVPPTETTKPHRD